MLAVKKIVVWATALCLVSVAGFAQDSTKAEKPTDTAKAEKVEAGADKATKPATEEGAGAKVEKKAEAKVVTTKSGLKYIDHVVGTGSVAGPGKKILVHYTGWLDENGKKGKQFDSSTGGDPLPVTLGATPQQVIDGWEEGITGMKAGGKRQLIIPPNLGYGKRGYPGYIPPDATLIFELELMKVTE